MLFNLMLYTYLIIIIDVSHFIPLLALLTNYYEYVIHSEKNTLIFAIIIMLSHCHSFVEI